MRKTFIAIATAGLLALTLTACGPAETPAPAAPPAAVVEKPAPAPDQPAPAADSFSTCAEAKAAGKRDLKASDYPQLEDRDHDGVVCES